jgi:hypothetical protein
MYNMQIFAILFFLSANLVFTQSPDSILITKQNEFNSFIIEKKHSPYSQVRKFQKMVDKEIPIEITGLNKQKQNYMELYYIIFDSSKTPLYFTTSEYINSNQCYLSHSYYFDSIGRTIFYSSYLGFYDSLSNKIVRKYHNFYFSTNFEILSQGEWFQDNSSQIIQDNSNYQLPYCFDVKYLGCNNFLSVIRKFKIKL